MSLFNTLMLCDPFRDRWLFSSELSGNHWLLSSELSGNHWLLSSELLGNHWLFSSELSGNHWLFSRCSAKDVSYASAEVHLALGGALLVRYATPATLSGPRVSTAGQRCGRTGRARPACPTCGRKCAVCDRDPCTKHNLDHQAHRCLCFNCHIASREARKSMRRR